jgi:hypothetical protein
MMGGSPFTAIGIFTEKIGSMGSNIIQKPYIVNTLKNIYQYFILGFAADQLVVNGQNQKPLELIEQNNRLGSKLRSVGQTTNWAIKYAEIYIPEQKESLWNRKIQIPFYGCWSV